MCIRTNFIGTGNIDQPCCRDELVVAIFTTIRNIIPWVMQSNARDERNENWQVNLVGSTRRACLFFFFFFFPFQPKNLLKDLFGCTNNKDGALRVICTCRCNAMAFFALIISWSKTGRRAAYIGEIGGGGGGERDIRVLLQMWMDYGNHGVHFRAVETRRWVYAVGI